MNNDIRYNKTIVSEFNTEDYILSDVIKLTCESCPARSKALGSEPLIVEVFAFESHPSNQTFVFPLYLQMGVVREQNPLKQGLKYQDIGFIS